MNQRPALSKGELEVARTIWSLGSATVGQAFEAIPEDRRPDYSTVQTYIRRLETKGYLRARRLGRNKVYAPKIRPSQVIRETVDDFMNRLFDGEAIPLMRHLINDRGITTDEISAIRQLLTEHEAEQNDEH
ncbi:MAG: BlaI/MecI/CopY family transcriptional regulator [Pirellulaceae bacterium]|jgi:predicted transcriptional regulator|nr:BlaI/MecI/CopY family transcriptional regulator [Pirellulaceae bacterium]MDP6553275.1 BlaI/MecI/CopY family transcriptional regulator [Pirellulaceae bacterium]